MDPITQCEIPQSMAVRWQQFTFHACTVLSLVARAKFPEGSGWDSTKMVNIFESEGASQLFGANAPNPLNGKETIPDSAVEDAFTKYFEGFVDVRGEPLGVGSEVTLICDSTTWFDEKLVPGVTARIADRVFGPQPMMKQAIVHGLTPCQYYNRERRSWQSSRDGNGYDLVEVQFQGFPDMVDFLEQPNWSDIKPVLTLRFDDHELTTSISNCGPIVVCASGVVRKIPLIPER